MKINLITIPVSNVKEHLGELNSFLSNNKIIELEKHLVQTPAGASWCFYISYENHYSVRNKYENSTSKIDYKNILTKAEFKKFDILRLIRKQIANEDAVSAFVIATDAELAEIAKLPEVSLTKLKTIKGIGEKKVEKYGKRIITGLEQFTKDENK